MCNVWGKQLSGLLSTLSEPCLELLKKAVKDLCAGEVDEYRLPIAQRELYGRSEEDEYLVCIWDDSSFSCNTFILSLAAEMMERETVNLKQ